MDERACSRAAEGIAPLLLPGCERNIKQMSVESFGGNSVP